MVWWTQKDFSLLFYNIHVFFLPSVGECNQNNKTEVRMYLPG